MSDQLFCFDPARYAAHFAEHGWVHIRAGVTEDFYRKMVAQVEESMRSKVMKEFAIGDKQQAMYEFPEGGDYLDELRRHVSGVVGLPPDELVVSERHVKAYEASADPSPKAHKDRFASEFSVGLSVHVRPGSTLVLYPYDELDVNPFNTSQQLRASFSPETAPEPRLTRARRVEINDAPRDVIVFRGHRIWHLRSNPASTTMLYLKMNALHCDPLGEDDRTDGFRQRTLGAAEAADDELAAKVVRIGRRVDYFHRHYDRFWQEVPGVVLWGEKHFTLSEPEFRMLRAVDGKRTAAAVIRAAEAGPELTLANIRRLARRGVIDLI
jgi:hypothetical protein